MACEFILAFPIFRFFQGSDSEPRSPDKIASYYPATMAMLPPPPPAPTARPVTIIRSSASGLEPACSPEMLPTDSSPSPPMSGHAHNHSSSSHHQAPHHAHLGHHQTPPQAHLSHDGHHPHTAHGHPQHQHIIQHPHQASSHSIYDEGSALTDEHKVEGSWYFYKGTEFQWIRRMNHDQYHRSKWEWFDLLIINIIYWLDD